MRKFLQSPYFNVNENLLNLFEILIEDINKTAGNKELEKEIVWSRIGKNGGYDDVRFRKYCSDLLKLFEKFIAQETFEEEHAQKAILNLKSVVKNRLVKLFHSSKKQAQKAIQNEAGKSSDYHYSMFQFEKAMYDLEFRDIKRAQDVNVERLNQSIDTFYLIEKLKIACDLLSRQSLIEREFHISLISEITAYIKSNMDTLHPVIKIYYYMYLTYIEEDESNYYKLKSLVEEYIDLIPPDEASSIYQSILNYCISRANRGRTEFLKELFNNYKYAVENKIIFNKGQLSPWDYKNVSILGLRLKKYEWTESFIREYNDYLPEAYQQNALTFNLAQLFFYQKKYEKVLELLRDVEYEDLSYNLSSKTFLVIIYYERDELDLLDSFIASFATFLNRRKDFSTERRKRYLNFLRYTKRLSGIGPSDKNKLEKMKLEISQTKGIVFQEWLLEKIEELS